MRPARDVSSGRFAAAPATLEQPPPVRHPDRVTPREYFHAFPDLEDLCLEQSWVLDLWATDSTLSFVLDPVFTEQPPSGGGAGRSARRALLTVSGSHVALRPSFGPRAVSADGTTDLGNIDIFWERPDGTWSLTGDWGEADVRDPVVELRLD